MGKTLFVRESKWLLLFLSLFACVLGAVGLSVSIVSQNQTETMVRAATEKIATYTIATKTSVSTSGTVPAGSSAAFSTTYTGSSKYQLTADNSMTLILSGYDGMTITGLTLSMHSNKSSGAGFMKCEIGSGSSWVTIASIGSSSSPLAFNNAAWHGDWSQNDYVDVQPSVSSGADVGLDENVRISIGATDNSLYCQSFTISYVGAGPSSATLYYASAVDEGLLAGHGGDELADDIHTLMWATTTTRVSYNSLKNHLQNTDTDLADEDYLLDFWTGEPLLAEWGNNIWNREHVWPAANSNGAWQRLADTDKSQRYGGVDLHHIRPSSSTLNVSRGNGALGIVDTSQDYANVVINGVTTDCLTGKNTSGTKVFEPGDNRKGDVARIYLYMYLTYSNTIHIKGSDYDLSDYDDDDDYNNRVANLTDVIVHSSALLDTGGTDYTNPIDLLLEWNKLDPVDENEAHRNEVAASIQGNRNPFIDFPEIADFIFVGGTFYGITMDETQTVLATDDFVPTARTMPAGASVTYTTSDSNIISISGSVFTVVGPGIVRITGTMTHNAITYTATTTVSVVTQVSSIVLSTSSYTMPSGMTFIPSAYCVPSNAYNRKITWSSDDEDVATVDATTGKITAVSESAETTTCTITATADADDTVTASLALTVLANSATSGAIDIEIGSFSDAESKYGNYDWASGTYSGKGWVSKSACMQLAGSAKSYVYNTTGFAAKISKIVLYSSSTNSTADADYDLYLGNSSAISDASALTEDATITVGAYGGTGAWTNTTGTNYTYFRIDTRGGKTHYLSHIRIILGSHARTLESLSADHASMKRTYNAGESLDLTGLSVTAHYDDGTNIVLDLTDPSCTVTPSNGAELSTANDRVTIGYSSMTAAISIAVAGAKTLSSVSIVPSTAVTIYQGYSRSLKAVATYSDGSKLTITHQAAWTSSNTNYATISDTGSLTGIAIGSATITASYTYLRTTLSGSVGVTISAAPAFEVTLTSSSNCVFGDSSYAPSFEATFGGDDVTDECVTSPSFTTAGIYTYYESLGEHEFTIRYADGNVVFTSTISIRTTNVGATNMVGSAAYSLVTSAAELSPGDTYIIASASELIDSSTAIMSTNQKKNNRGQVIYGVADPAYDIQALTLGGEDGAWTLYAGSGFLYAPSSSSNELKTRAENSDGNSRWDISFTEDGAANIVAQGSATHNVMRYNFNDSLFACYEDSTKVQDMYLFKSRTSTFTPNEQAYAMKTYLDGLRTCDVTSEADVKRLALEYNTLNCTTVNATTAKAVFSGLFTTSQYEPGVDYVNGEYITNTPTGDAIPCLDKIRYIVATWNVNHPDDLIYLYTDAYYAGTDSNGGGTKETPSYAYDIHSLRHGQEGSPLTITLWIVLGAGLTGLGAISAAYFISNKKKKYVA